MSTESAAENACLTMHAPGWHASARVLPFTPYCAMMTRPSMPSLRRPRRNWLKMPSNCLAAMVSMSMRGMPPGPAGLRTLRSTGCSSLYGILMATESERCMSGDDVLAICRITIADL